MESAETHRLQPGGPFRKRVCEVPGCCCLLSKGWLLKFGVFPGCMLLFPESHVLLQKARRGPDEVSDPVAIIFRS